MASFTDFVLKIYKTIGAEVVAGCFQLNSTSNPDVITGKGFTVTRTTTGKFLVTFSETFSGVISIVATAGLAAAAVNGDAGCHLSVVTLGSSISSFTVYRQVAGTDADTDNSQVHFLAVLARSSLSASSRSS